MALLLDLRTFISYPVFTSDGTLCGASKEVVLITADILDLMRECARLLGERVTRSD